jgi:hypothetical protein
MLPCQAQRSNPTLQRDWTVGVKEAEWRGVAVSGSRDAALGHPGSRPGTKLHSEAVVRSIGLTPRVVVAIYSWKRLTNHPKSRARQWPGQSLRHRPSGPARTAFSGEHILAAARLRVEECHYACDLVADVRPPIRLNLQPVPSWRLR